MRLAALALAALTGSAGSLAHLDSGTKPTEGASCYNAPNVLGLSNMPVTSSERITSVVNMMAYVTPIDYRPIAWIFKNLRGDWFIRANGKFAAAIYRTFPTTVAEALLSVGDSDQAEPPQKMTSETTYDPYFAKLGAIKVTCFESDFPMPP